MRRTATAVLVLLLLRPGVALAQHEHGAAPAPDPGAPADHPADAGQALPSFIREPTDADRAAAFPDVGEHPSHGTGMHSFVLVDHVEWQSGDGKGAVALDARGWIGGDVSRLWFRAQSAGRDGASGRGGADVFYGHSISRWWDVVAGVRQDIDRGPTRTWAAIGLQGLAPYWFEVEATAYVGGGGGTRLHLETDYDLRLTPRLVLQPAAAIDAYGKDDPEHHRAAGIGTVEGALRLRYEIRREFAPYVGVVWERSVGGTADLVGGRGGVASDRNIVVGARVWF